MSDYGSSSDSSEDSAPSLWAAARAHENRAKAAQPMVGATSKSAPTAKKTLPAPIAKPTVPSRTCLPSSATLPMTPMTPMKPMTPAPAVSSASASSSVLTPSLARCPDSVQMPLEWNQVRYYTHPVTGKRSMDWKNSPIDIPHPELYFKGYVVDAQNNTISAFFAKEGVKRKMGVRCPRPAGGVNKRFFDGRNRCETDLDRSEFNTNNAKLFTPRSHRFGSQDPEI
jgi:hypothetical protein